MTTNYILIPGTKVPVRAWIKGVPLEQSAENQIRNVASLPVIFEHGIAIMADCHWGNGATVGSVIPTYKAIIPAAVGVDIGCGMIATKTTLRAEDLPDSLVDLRISLEAAVPHGGPGVKGSWLENGYKMPKSVEAAWHIRVSLAYNSESLATRYKKLLDKHHKLASKADYTQLGTLGGGNHFIELCLDTEGSVWVVLHSGSRGPGNVIGTQFIRMAKEDMEETHLANLPDRNLAYLQEGTQHFFDYVEAVQWAQDYAKMNRHLMMMHVIETLHAAIAKPFEHDLVAVNCHHNYVQLEEHFGQLVYLTRKGAVSAREGEWGIIPGSMGTKSYIVRGRGNPESYHSCSHGAGRVLSRGAAKSQFTTEDVVSQTSGVECRKDAGIIDELPGAYKDIDAVMEAQKDLVEIMYTLKQVLCIKG